MGAVVIYPALVPVAAGQLKGTGVHVASVAGAFPSGLGPLDERLAEIRDAVQMGADEIDIVLNRSAFLSGRYRQAFEEIAASKEACGATTLKVILETGELGSYDQVRRASVLAMAAGASFAEAARLANLAGGIVVFKRGTSTVSADEMMSSMGQLSNA